MNNHEDIRARLETHLGISLSEKEWELLEEECLIEMVEEGEETIAGVARRVRRYRAVWGQQVPDEGDMPPMLNREPCSRERNGIPERLRAISVLLAHDAAQDSMVIAFRRAVLNNQLIEPEEVEEWINQQASADGKPTQLLNGVPLPPDVEIQSDRAAGGGSPTRPS